MLAFSFIFFAFPLLVVASSPVPTFYVDPLVLSIFNARADRCLRGGTAMKELDQLRSDKGNADAFFRSQELYAYHYFVEMGDNNPHRRSLVGKAEFEYVPILPLHWRRNSHQECSYQSLMRDILKYITYTKSRDQNQKALPVFFVSGAYNLRTWMGTGMPTQQRRGDIWTSVSQFTEGISIGHYERWPQCPDLLRKSWKYVVEVPYVPVNMHHGSHSIAYLGTEQVTASTFHFSGNFDLYGCELVCSVRNAIIDLAHSRADITVVNVTLSDANSPIDYSTLRLMRKSTFCLIAKQDSYSTSSFYHAIAMGCIPIVISDWFVFSYPWIVDYEHFVIRLSERDFTADPSLCLDHILTTVGKHQLDRMRAIMRQAVGLLSYEKVPYRSEEYMSLMSHDKYFDHQQQQSLQAIHPPGTDSIVPLDLLLLELRYAQEEYKYYNNVPCFRPYMCYHNRNSTITPEQAALRNVYNKNKKTRYYDFTANPLAAALALPHNKENEDFLKVNRRRSSNVHEAIDFSGYQVPNTAVHFQTDSRSHLCRHNTRLIGHYKIVFFMQCVRILWPLAPGKFKPPDQAREPALPLPDVPVRSTFSSSYQPIGKGKDVAETEGISWQDQLFVLGFHNVSGYRPPGWALTHYPLLPSSPAVVNGTMRDLHGAEIKGLLMLDQIKS
jgi:hypothetical protein